MQKILTVILAGVVCASFIPFSSAAESDSADYVGPSSHFFPNPGDYTSVLINTEEILFGHGTAPIRACFAEATEQTCTEPFTEGTCGGLAMSSAEIPEGLLVQVLGVLLTDDLYACPSSAGTIHVSWF